MRFAPEAARGRGAVAKSAKSTARPLLVIIAASILIFAATMAIHSL
jgi:hypothetical protein